VGDTEDAVTVPALDIPAAVLRIACGIEDGAINTVLDKLSAVLETACVERGPAKMTA